ncbi:MAG: hypothetical protein R3C28_11365 [Pirellulaceae bacterium]
MNDVLEMVFRMKAPIPSTLISQVQTLLDTPLGKGISIDDRIRYLRLAVRQNRPELVRLLAKEPQIGVAGSEADPFPPLLIDAINVGNPDIVRELIKAGVDIDVRYTDESLALSLSHYDDVFDASALRGLALSPVHLALMLRKPLSVLRALLQAPGIDVNGLPSHAPSPLMIAGLQPNLAAFELLLGMLGIDLAYRDYKGRSVVEFAADGAHYSGSAACLIRLITDKRFAAEVSVKKGQIWIGGQLFDREHGGYSDLATRLSELEK